MSNLFRLRENVADPFSELAVSVGVGNGRFLREQDWRDKKNTMNFFGSAAIRVMEPASVIVDWTGQDLALAISIAPFRKLPLVITPGVLDLTGTAGDGARFGMAAALGYHFTFPKQRLAPSGM